MRQERAYRRGTVAGLSLGEVFILLSFVLVLAVLLISIDFRSEGASESVEPTDTNSIELRDPDSIQTLVEERDAARKERDSANKKLDSAEQKIQTLVEERDAARKERDSANKKLDSAEQKLQRLEDQVKDLRSGEGDRADDEFDDLDEAKMVIDELYEVVATQNVELAERDQEIKGLKSKIRDLREALTRAEEQIEERIKKSEKGSNPPCWYELVSAEGGSGTRERAIYALDLRVTDLEIMFGNRGLPPGAAKGSDSRGRSFAAEAEMLGLPDMPYGVWLTHAQASSELKKLADAGAASEVRTYPCKFFAKIWDQTGTGPESKDNWRRIREDVIERFVLIYVVKDDPWPH